MSKKLILSQAQVDRLTEADGMGGYIKPDSKVGAVGHNEIELEPCDMRDTKDKERDSDVKYKPVDTDDIKKFMNVPQVPWGGSHIRTPYAAGYIAETYTKEEFEKLALDEINKNLKNRLFTATIETPQGQVSVQDTEGNLAVLSHRLKKAGNLKGAKDAKKPIEIAREQDKRRRKFDKEMGVNDPYRDSNLFDDNN